MKYSALFIVAAAALVAAVPLKYGEPGYVLQYGDPGYSGPKPEHYGEKGYAGYNGHKGETREIGILRFGRFVHSLAHEAKEQIKSDLHRVINFLTCHINTFKYHWRLRLEYRRNKRCKWTELELQKIKEFEEWCRTHKSELDARLKECHESSSSSEEKVIYKADYQPPACTPKPNYPDRCEKKLY
jgi:hypothetical protein